MRTGPKIGVAVVAGGLALGAVAFVAMRGGPESPPREVAEPSGEQAPRPGMAPDEDPSKPSYPEDWRVSGIREATEAAGFKVLVPDVPAANPGNLTDAFVTDTGAVALDFPAPAKPEAFVRTEYIEVYQSLGAEEDPLAVYEQDVAHSPDSTSIMEIDGIPVMTVTPHSPYDIERANPAYIEFVVDGIDVQVVGGENLDLLEEIAADMIAKA